MSEYGLIRHVAGIHIQLLLFHINSHAQYLSGVIRDHCGSHIAGQEPIVCALSSFISVILKTISVFQKKGYGECKRQWVISPFNPMLSVWSG